MTAAPSNTLDRSAGPRIAAEAAAAAAAAATAAAAADALADEGPSQEFEPAPPRLVSRPAPLPAAAVAGPRRVSFACPGPLVGTLDGHPPGEGKTAVQRREVPHESTASLTPRHLAALAELLGDNCLPSIFRLERRAGRRPLRVAASAAVPASASAEGPDQSAAAPPAAAVPSQASQGALQTPAASAAQPVREGGGGECARAASKRKRGGGAVACEHLGAGPEAGSRRLRSAGPARGADS